MIARFFFLTAAKVTVNSGRLVPKPRINPEKTSDQPNCPASFIAPLTAISPPFQSKKMDIAIWANILKSTILFLFFVMVFFFF